MPFLRVDLMIAAVIGLKVHTAPVPNGVACVIEVREAGGEELSFALSPEALAELVKALIENSPRTPGTPGRN